MDVSATNWITASPMTEEVLIIFVLGFLLYTDATLHRDHVKHDLDPYVCLFEPCDTPTALYNRSEDWLNHMRQHKLRWRCAAKSHAILVFEDRSEYEEHMSTKHKGTKSQVALLAERSSRSSGPIFESCPLCGESDSNRRLEDHIAGHLRYLALKSLPFIDECGDDDGSEEVSVDSEKTDHRTRTTIVDDPDYDVPLDLDRQPTVIPLDDFLLDNPALTEIPVSNLEHSEWGFMPDFFATGQESDPILEAFQAKANLRSQEMENVVSIMNSADDFSAASTREKVASPKMHDSIQDKADVASTSKGNGSLLSPNELESQQQYNAKAPSASSATSENLTERWDYWEPDRDSDQESDGEKGGWDGLSWM